MAVQGIDCMCRFRSFTAIVLFGRLLFVRFLIVVYFFSLAVDFSPISS